MEHKEQVACHYLQLLDDLKWSTQEVAIRSVMTVNKVKDKQIALRNGQARELLFKRYRERSVIKISRGCYVFTSNKNTLTLTMTMTTTFSESGLYDSYISIYT